MNNGMRYRPERRMDWGSRGISRPTVICTNGFRRGLGHDDPKRRFTNSLGGDAR